MTGTDRSRALMAPGFCNPGIGMTTIWEWTVQ
jgi:hypothetical protein